MLRRSLISLSLLFIWSTGFAVNSVCTPTGSQNVVAILVNLQNYSLPSNVTTSFVSDFLFGNPNTSNPDLSLNDFLTQNSSNQTSLSLPSASTVVALSQPLASDYNANNTCNWTNMETDAIAAALQQGVDASQYSRVIFVVPNNNVCNANGYGRIGCGTLTSPNGSFIASDMILVADSNHLTNRQNSVSEAAQYFGHNLGLGDARTRSCAFISGNTTYYDPLGPFGNTCPINSYGDPFSPMGRTGALGFYSAPHAADLGWLQPNLNSNYPSYLMVNTSGSYTIQNYENTSGNIVKALQIQRGNLVNNNAWIWVEARTNTGNYDSTLDPHVFNGALIHYQDSNTTATFPNTDLLDFTPFTSAWTDATLQVGQSWNDPYSNLAITVTGETSNSLTLNVNYLPSAPICTPTAPAVTISPNSITLQPGSSTVFTVTATNPVQNCLNKLDTMFIGSPGWPVYWNNTPGLLTYNVGLQAGQSTTGKLYVTVPAGTAPGQYGVSGRAEDSSNALNPLVGFGLAVITVPDTLTVTISGTGTVTSSPAGISCPGTCSGPFNPASVVVLTATPTAPNNKVTWGAGPCSGISSTSCNVTMTGNISQSVTFSAVTTSGGGKGGHH